MWSPCRLQLILLSGCVAVQLAQTALGGASAAAVSDATSQPAAPHADAALPDVLPPASRRFSMPDDPDFRPAEVPDFQRHVLPLLGRSGCNGRACHGSFQGAGGLQLSLFGYDLRQDHAALTQPGSSSSESRVDRQQPDNSLILLKPSEQVPHAGGRRLETNSWQYQLLRAWIAAGAQNTEQPLTLQALEVEPRELLFRQPAEQARVRVVAVWSNGLREDVTCLTRFRTNDDQVAVVDADGLVTAADHGDTHLIAFYDNAVAAVSVICPLPASQSQGLTWPTDLRTTAVDRLVNARLQKLGLIPSPVCTDAEFLRRAAIDLTGTLPTAEEAARFLADTHPDKRDRKIDELLARPAWAAWWATKLCDFTGCNPSQQSELGQELAEQWYMWIYQRLLEHTPYDRLVEGIVLAQGRTPGQSWEAYTAEMSAYFRSQQPADFSQRATMPHYWSRRSLQKSEDKALAFAHSFLGLRLQCAQCHKHPWDRWTQQDFQQFSAFFDSVRFGVAPDAAEAYAQLARQVGLNSRDSNGTAVRPDILALAQAGQSIPWREVFVAPHEQDSQLQLLGSGLVTLPAQQDPRVVLMQWLRDPAQPWFARAFVNRVWASCFLTGIVDPPDDLNAANPPSNPELLDWLTAEFMRREYDIRWLLREIVSSSTWQRSWQANATNSRDQRNFSRAIPRRIPAEVLYDGIKQVTAASDKQDTVREDLTRRAVGHLSMRMAGTYAMHVFGKPERAVTCDCERVNEPTLLQAVFMQNDPLIQMQLDESGWLAEIRQTPAPVTDAQRQAWITTAWLRAVGRYPTAAELTRAQQHLAEAESAAAGLTDILWALLNTKEFLLNH